MQGRVKPETHSELQFFFQEPTMMVENPLCFSLGLLFCNVLSAER